MFTFKFLARAVAALVLALAIRALTAETVTLRFSPSGVEIKAEGSRPLQPQAKE